MKIQLNKKITDGLKSLNELLKKQTAVRQLELTGEIVNSITILKDFINRKEWLNKTINLWTSTKSKK